MNGEERRKNILHILTSSDKPVAGVALARELSVSRQVIVQDIALLRANGVNIFSTNRGYLIQEKDEAVSRVFKVRHEENEAEEELNMIIDIGGIVKDVFVYHKVYGVLKADMNIKSRRDIRRYMDDITSGKSNLLMNVTSGYHYHTIIADDEQTLDLIQEELQKRGFWAKLQDYEPVNFWGEEENT
ncbi:MAG: transcription repressor NadR [Agathobacter sp.]|nr:transcription repressor NadR [Agathobacter sp.]